MDIQLNHVLNAHAVILQKPHHPKGAGFSTTGHPHQPLFWIMFSFRFPFNKGNAKPSNSPDCSAFHWVSQPCIVWAQGKRQTDQWMTKRSVGNCKQCAISHQVCTSGWGSWPCAGIWRRKWPRWGIPWTRPPGGRWSAPWRQWTARGEERRDILMTARGNHFSWLLQQFGRVEANYASICPDSSHVQLMCMSHVANAQVWMLKPNYKYKLGANEVTCDVWDTKWPPENVTGQMYPGKVSELTT